MEFPGNSEARTSLGEKIKEFFLRSVNHEVLLVIQKEKSSEQELDLSLEYRVGVWTGNRNLGHRMDRT